VPELKLRQPPLCPLSYEGKMPSKYKAIALNYIPDQQEESLPLLRPLESFLPQKPPSQEIWIRIRLLKTSLT
jgi:hypothetical protein